MANKIVSFDEFKGGSGLNDPKKIAHTQGKGDTLPKEKVIDQVKYCDLAKLKVNQADYEKTKKVAIQEGLSSASQAIQVKIDQLDQQIAKLDQTDPNYTSNKTDLDQQKQDLLTQLEAQTTKDAQVPQPK